MRVAGRRQPAKRARSGRVAVLGILVVAVLVAVVWWVLQGNRGGAADRLDPAVGMDLRTLVGQPAPELTLADAEGREYTVPAPGRPTVLIFHMGFF